MSYGRHVPDREPAMWAGVDKNVINDTYAFADGTMVRRDNDCAKAYSRAYSKICRVKRRGNNRAVRKLANKAWGKYGNYVKDGIRKEARWLAGRGIAVGHEDLATHKLYTKDQHVPHTKTRTGKAWLSTMSGFCLCRGRPNHGTCLGQERQA